MLLPLLVACAAKPVSKPTVSPSANPTAAEAELPGEIEQLVRAICAEHPPPCRMIEGEDYDAGQDAEGRALLVVAIDPKEEPADSSAEESSEEPAEEPAEETAEEPAEDDASDYDDDHETREYWVGVFDAGRLVSHTQVTTAYFQREDHDPNAPEESTSVEIAENRLRARSSGYRGGRDWGHEIVYRLSPLAVIYEANSHGDALTAASSEHRWDRLAFRGGNFRSAVVCGQEELSNGDWNVAERAYLYVPLMSVPASYRDGDWKTVSPGSCAVSLEAANALPVTASVSAPEEMTVPPGFLTHGAPDSESDSAMRVFLGDSRTLFVEVYDDAWVTAGKNWLHTDHLEIWLGLPEEVPGELGCVREERGRNVVQWGVRLDSGAVISAYGQPRQKPTVEVAAPAHAAAPARLAIVLPDMKYERITVVYSDSDDGTRQDYLLATSALRHGVADSLGESWPQHSRARSCIMGAHGLERGD